MQWLDKPLHKNPPNDPPYLNRPLLPLAVVLPRMLEQIEAELTGRRLEAGEDGSLRRRVELIRGLLAPSPLI